MLLDCTQISLKECTSGVAIVRIGLVVLALAQPVLRLLRLMQPVQLVLTKILQGFCQMPPNSAEKRPMKINGLKCFFKWRLALQSYFAVSLVVH